MVQINGFKVIGPTEVVIGKVVEFEERKGEFPERLKLVEYYINGYNTYVHRTLASFDTSRQDNNQQTIKAFKDALKNFARVSDVFVEQSVMEYLLS